MLKTGLVLLCFILVGSEAQAASAAVPAMPAIRASCEEEAAVATPITRLAVETIPSLAP